MRERLGHEVVVDRDALVHRVFLLPRRRLHFVEAGAHDDLHFLAAQAARRAAAVHGRVAATEHDHPLADARHVAERNGRQPVDADVDVRRRFAASGNVEVAPARRAAADEHGVPAFGEQLLHAVDALAAAEFDAEIEHVADFLVDHGIGKAELGYLRADHAAGARVAVEDHAFVAERRQVARHRQRCGSRADQRDALAVLLRGGLRQTVADVFLEVRRDALQAADGDGFRLGLRVGDFRRAFLDAAAPARGFAWAIAGPAEDAGEHIRLPVDEIRVAVMARCDQPDVFGDGSVGRAGPLAIDNFVEIVGVRDIRRLQSLNLQWHARSLMCVVRIDSLGKQDSRRDPSRCRDATPAAVTRKAVYAPRACYPWGFCNVNADPAQAWPAFGAGR